MGLVRTAAIVLFGVLLAAALYAVIARDAGMSLPSVLETLRGPMVTSLLMGIVGGAIGSFMMGRSSSHHRRELDARLSQLEGASARDKLGSRKSSQRPNYAPPEFTGEQTRASPKPEPQETYHPAVVPDQFARNEEPRPAKRPALSEAEVMQRYRAATSGTLSRAAFADFLQTVGTSGPVKLLDGGSRLIEADNSETFLVSVMNGEQLLVFPSYEFLSNQHTQFSTVASVPEDVAAAFELSRGDGDVALISPATYRPDGEGFAELSERGHISGFGG